MKGKLTSQGAEQRARDIADLRAKGKPPKEIAAALGVHRSVVSYYLSGRCKAAHHAGIFTADRPAQGEPWNAVTTGTK